MEAEKIAVANPSEGAVHGGHELPYHAAKGLDYFPQVITNASGIRYVLHGELLASILHQYLDMQFANLQPNSWVQ
jgi:hypothetical protein